MRDCISALIGFLLVLSVGFAEQLPVQRPGWPFFFGEDGDVLHRTNLTVTTLEDGSPIIAAASAHYLGVFDLNGNPLLGWPLRFTNPFVGAGPVVGDVDGDQVLDLFVAMRNNPITYRSIVRYSLTGEIDTIFTREFADGMQYPITSPVLVNLDNDSMHTDEIIFTADSLYAVYGDGTPFPGFPWYLGGTAVYISGIVVGSGDEWEQPVVFWSTFGWLHARQINQGEELDGWPVRIQNNEFLSNPVLIPSENDWNIAIGTADTIWVFDSNGEVLPGFPIVPMSEAITPFLNFITVGDVNGNGIPDLLFKLNDEYLHVVNLQGNYLNGFPVAISDNGFCEPCTVIRDRILTSAMIFSSNSPDTIWTNEILGLRYNSMLPGFPILADVPSSQGSIALIPPVDDTLHIVYNSNNGLLNVWDLPMEGVGTNIEWQMPGSTPGGNPIYRPQPPLEEQNSVLESLPATIELKTIYPNPGNGSFTFSVLPHRTGQVSVRVHNVLGQSVWEESFPVWAGVERSLVWPATDNSGRPVPSGIYLIDVDGNVSGAMKAVLLR